MSFKKIFYRSFFVAFLFISIFFGVAYRVCMKAVGRAQYSQERKKRNKENYLRLVREYGAQPVEFTTEDGINISGLLISRKSACRNILLCHAYGGNKEQLAWFLRIFPNDNVLLFDFRGHGQSGGDLVTIGYLEENDVAVAFRFLKNEPQTKDLPVVGLGISMGAASIVRAAAHGVDFEKIILDSSFSNLFDHIEESFSWRTGLPRIPFTCFVSRLFCFLTGLTIDDHNPAELIASVSCPVFIVHSEGDQMIPVQHAHKIYAGAHKEKELWIAPCSRHGYACKDCLEAYSKKVGDFLFKSFA